ncbi:MAG: YggS family pyridoxal phosphate-dependent enzyme [Ilumatobacteraceae bacterium]|nr:YggS family pyridoxal phosphate-dependent enzyme [Ilumatobacteraceae bacterium]
MIDANAVADRVAQVRSVISNAGGTDVSLVAVTKSFGIDALRAALAAECDAVGENYAQELLEKTAEGMPLIDVHFIGALQSNKVRSLAGHIALWQSVDRESVVDELGRRASGASILIQVDTTGEPSKGGVTPAQLGALRSRAESRGLIVKGLMTIGPTDGTRQECEKSFGMLRHLVNEQGLSVCSMGMSADYPIAVACGSTMVRVGSGLFGDRERVTH